MLMVHSRRLGQGFPCYSFLQGRPVVECATELFQEYCRSRSHSTTRLAGITSMASLYPYPPIPADCEDSLKPPSGRASINLPRELTLVTSQAPLPPLPPSVMRWLELSL
jgi:hypothetical protein